MSGGVGLRCGRQEPVQASHHPQRAVAVVDGDDGIGAEARAESRDGAGVLGGDGTYGADVGVAVRGSDPGVFAQPAR